MPTTTVVRVTTDLEKMLACPVLGLYPDKAKGIMAFLGGRDVVVLLPPLDKPTHSIEPPYPPPCPSKQWQLENSEKARLHLVNDMDVFFCEHMLDVD